MAWLAGLAPISGPRWSCAAYWAEDGNPQASDTDWADSSTWDAAHAYDADAEISLGVFIAGEDVTARVRSASWGLGQGDPLPQGVQPSSCQLTLRDDGSALPDWRARVVILTEWDVLWSGIVDSAAAVSSIDRTEHELSCVDDLAIANVIEVSDRELGGSVPDVLDTMVLAAGLNGGSWLGEPGDHDYSGWPYFITTPRSGSILELLGAALLTATLAGSWTPYGLRITYLPLAYYADYRTPVQTFDVLRSITRRPAVDRIVNTMLLSSATFGDSEVVRSTSVDTYGVRRLDIDYEGWIDPGSLETFWWPGILDGYAGIGYAVPLQMIDADARVKSTRHDVTRLLPFDQVSDGDPDDGGTTERYRVLQTAHRVTPDDWSVSFTAVRLYYVAP